jgi:hypothetical protein
VRSVEACRCGRKRLGPSSCRVLRDIVVRRPYSARGRTAPDDGLTCPTVGTTRVQGRVSAADVVETSGIVASTSNQGIFWVHSGARVEIFRRCQPKGVDVLGMRRAVHDCLLPVAQPRMSHESR